MSQEKKAIVVERPEENGIDCSPTHCLWSYTFVKARNALTEK
jgi:hypothetical protein